MPLRMHGHSMKVKSRARTGTEPRLAATGAQDTILRRREGADGPRGVTPRQVRFGGALVTAVRGLPGPQVVLPGFADDRILVSESQEVAEAMFVKRLRGPVIEILGVATGEGWSFAADAGGCVHRMPQGRAA